MPWPEKTSAKKTKQKPEKSFYSEDESSPEGKAKKIIVCVLGPRGLARVEQPVWNQWLGQ